MNIFKTSRKNVQDDDLSCASTSSTSKVTFEDSNDGDNEGTSYDDDDDTLCDDDDDDTLYDENKLLQKLADLRVTYCQKKVECTAFERTIEMKNVSEFVNNLLFNKDLNDSDSEEQKRTIIELYERNAELCKRLRSVTKKNRDATKEIFQLYIRVKDLTKERKIVWDEAVKLYKMHLGDSSAFLNLDETDSFNETNLKEKEKEFLLRAIDYEVVKKAFRIVQIARILYNLITNSGVSWGTDENLLEILECVSKLLDRNLDLRNPKEFIKTVDEVTYSLNNVKI